jgi:protease IV
MKRRTVFVLAACIAAVAFGAALVGGIALFLRYGGTGGGESSGWSSTQYLDLQLDGELPEQPPAAFGTFLEKQPLALRTVVRSLDRAAKDSKVKAVVLRVNMLPGVGWGKVEELRAAIKRFRAAGKEAYAHLEFSGNKEYYLATACSKIYAVPTGLLDVTGLEAEVTFFRGTLDKLGIEAEFEGVGKYKNAPNQFTEKAFTEPHREQMVGLLDSLFGSYVKEIAASRGVTEEKARALIDDGPYDAREAKDAGLVDELLYKDELVEKLDDADRLTPARYVRSSGGGLGLGRPKFALIYIVGEIVLGSSQDDPFGSEGVAGSETVAEAIRDAREDDDVKAIVIRIDSPGGSGTASDIIWREVRLAQEKKPVIASMGDYAASGGYYVAMGSDAIVAQPGTITGSIGVFAGKFSLRGFYDKIGFTKEIITRGENADIFTDYRTWTPEERARVRGLMESFYDEFITKAAEGRAEASGKKVSPEDVHIVAQGRVWTGTEALEHGLVDKLGGLDTAIALAKEKAKIEADTEVELLVLPKRKGLLETLLEQDDDSLIESRLPAEIRGLLRWARTLHNGAPSARLPFDLRVR